MLPPASTGQAWLDIPNLGWSIVTVADGDPALAAGQGRRAGRVGLEGPARVPAGSDAGRRGASHRPRDARGAIVLADSSDGTAGGAEGDSTVLLRGLLESPVPGPCCCSSPTPKRRPAARPWGGTRDHAGGRGKLTPAFFQARRLTGTVRTLSDGKFQMKNPKMPANRGLTAVLQAGTSSSSSAGSPYTPGTRSAIGRWALPREGQAGPGQVARGFRPSTSRSPRPSSTWTPRPWRQQPAAAALQASDAPCSRWTTSSPQDSRNAIRES